MLYEAEGTTPLQNFAIMYSDSYFVTEEQAYNATLRCGLEIITSIQY